MRITATRVPPVRRHSHAIPLLLLLAATAIQPQTNDAFEVVSLKPSRPDTRFSATLNPDHFVATGHTLMMLIMSAYPEIEVKPWTLTGGPKWLTADRWDLNAKLPPNVPADQEILYRRTEAMLRRMLAEEFKLKTHRETKETPVYALTVASGGPKLKAAAGNQFSAKPGRGRLEFQCQSMAGLAEYLFAPAWSVRQAADRPVIDKTGLKGVYDFSLEWTPDTAQADPASTAPSIYAALEQQLGLKLRTEKASVEYLVIDGAEKPPAN